MVRLRDLRVRLALSYELHFNSSMVRLRDGADTRTTSESEFQFQYGTIKRITNKMQVFRRVKFQFQYGTIKRIKGIHPKRDNFHFNSSMVRLREATGKQLES